MVNDDTAVAKMPFTECSVVTILYRLTKFGSYRFVYFEKKDVVEVRFDTNLPKCQFSSPLWAHLCMVRSRIGFLLYHIVLRFIFCAK